MCPSDGNVGSVTVTNNGATNALDNSSVGSVGTTTLSPNGGTGSWSTAGSTGMFWYYRSYGESSRSTPPENPRPDRSFPRSRVGMPSRTLCGP
jgi:hypothetical protein